jgi:hypothetical protein
MARMIPANIAEEDFHGSYGESSVFDSLKKLPDEYTVFHSVHWNKKNNNGGVNWGESDFAIFHPKKGLIVVEVKSGGIVCTDGKWSQVNTMSGEIYTMKDPMAQAERSKFVLKIFFQGIRKDIMHIG